MIEDGLFSYLSGAGVGVLARIYPNTRPQKKQGTDLFPCIVYRRVSSNFGLVFLGPAAHTLVVMNVRIYDEDFTQAHTIADTVRIKLQGYQGTFGTHQVKSIQMIDQLDEYEPPKTGTEKGIYSVSMDFQIEYNETVILV